MITNNCQQTKKNRRGKKDLCGILVLQVILVSLSCAPKPKEAKTLQSAAAKNSQSGAQKWANRKFKIPVLELAYRSGFEIAAKTDFIIEDAQSKIPGFIGDWTIKNSENLKTFSTQALVYSLPLPDSGLKSLEEVAKKTGYEHADLGITQMGPMTCLFPDHKFIENYTFKNPKVYGFPSFEPKSISDSFNRFYEDYAVMLNKTRVHPRIDVGCTASIANGRMRC
jgi:hypothetical protein